MMIFACAKNDDTACAVIMSAVRISLFRLRQKTAPGGAVFCVMQMNYLTFFATTTPARAMQATAAMAITAASAVPGLVEAP